MAKKPAQDLERLLESVAVHNSKVYKVYEVDKAKAEKAYLAIKSDDYILKEGYLYILIDGEEKELILGMRKGTYSDSPDLSGGSKEVEGTITLLQAEIDLLQMEIEALQGFDQQANTRFGTIEGAVTEQGGLITDLRRDLTSTEHDVGGLITNYTALEARVRALEE